MHRIENGELVVYLARRTQTKAINLGHKPNPVIGVYSSLNTSIRDNPKHIFNYGLISLLPGNLILDGEKRPVVAQNNAVISIADSQLAEIYIGKREILEYLDSRRDLGRHKPWIRNLKAPYKDSFPKVRTIWII